MSKYLFLILTEEGKIVKYLVGQNYLLDQKGKISQCDKN